jgi:hypothetical protein
MGKAKTDRTAQLRQAQVSYLMKEQAVNDIEQHNFDRLVASGVLVEGGPSEKAKPPKGRAVALSTT